MKKLISLLVVAIVLMGGVVFADEPNEAGVGIDLVLFEQGDETTSNLNDVSWLKSISVEYRCDLNSQPEHKAYLVTKIKLGDSWDEAKN